MNGEPPAPGASQVASAKPIYPTLPSNRSSPFPPGSAATKAGMPAPSFLAQAQPFRSGVTSQSPFPLTMPGHGQERDAPKPVGTPFGSSVPAQSSALIRRLPLNTSQESIRLMVVWSKELVDVELLPVEQSEDAGFRSAILKFKTPAGALEAKNMLDGRSNISNDANMIVEILSGSSPASSRRYATDSAGGSSTTSSATSSAPSSRQTSRFNGPFQSLEKVSPPLNGLYNGKELPNPESSTHYQNLFSPQSPIGNHLTERTRISGKTLIKNDAADDDETGELLKDPVAYAENGAATAQRRATAPHIPVSRLANLSLNTNTPGPSSLPHFGHQSLSTLSSHSNGMSPNVMNGGAHQHYMTGQPFGRMNFPPVNPADQNPPCNTLYVGNLPIDTSEEELKAMFSKQRGYKRLCFRTKQNGPMCFVEFEDVSFATKALHELYGHPLHNSVKGGIRLSFSKNPLGVRSGPAPAPAAPPMPTISSMMSGNTNAYPTSNAPPGLSTPPGFGSNRYGGGGGNHPSHGHNGSTTWAGSIYNNAMAAGGPSSMGNGNTANYVPPHMLGR